MANNDKMPEDSTEYLIDKELQPLIEKVRYKAIEPGYRNKFSDYEILGMIVSKYCRWDIENIKQVFSNALEDSNYHDAAEEVSKWAMGGQLNKKYSLKELFTK